MSIQNSTNNEKPIIEHIVISGGVIYGFTFYGILKQLNIQKFWDITNIKTIHATSAGTIVALIISLNYNWTLTDNYLIYRPMSEIFKMDISAILSSFDNCGLFGINTFFDFFENLFEGKDISINVTMKDFYEKTKVELHFYTTSLFDFKTVDISYKTHPEWKVVEACYASCAVPLLFQPFIKDEQMYCDGGILVNYPIQQCVEPLRLNPVNNIDDTNKDIQNTNIIANNVINENTILGINTNVLKKQQQHTQLKYTLLEYILFIIKTVLKTLSQKKQTKITNEIVVNINFTPMFDMRTIMIMEKRKELIEYGVKIAKEFMDINI
jgi:predicted acylesterase/phospholipase RssA